MMMMRVCTGVLLLAAAGSLQGCQDNKPKPPGPVAPTTTTTKATPAAEKVSVELYFESLCPGCRGWIKEQLTPLLADKELAAIVDVKLWPYGNAIRKDDGTFKCQHGPKECLGNQLDACVLHHAADFHKAWPIIQCLENHVEETKGDAAKMLDACADTLGDLDKTKITACYTGNEGFELEKKIADQTEALSPSHSYVPWVVVEGKHESDAEEHLKQVVCSLYQGTKPKSCASAALEPAGPKLELCMAEEIEQTETVVYV